MDGGKSVGTLGRAGDWSTASRALPDSTSPDKKISDAGDSVPLVDTAALRPGEFWVCVLKAEETALGANRLISDEGIELDDEGTASGSCSKLGCVIHEINCASASRPHEKPSDENAAFGSKFGVCW